MKRRDASARVQTQTVDVAALEQRIGIVFNDRALLRTALTHSSYINEYPDAGEHNERLEFLGDGVLCQIAKYFLYRTCAEREGRLTDLLNLLVSNRTLAAIGEELRIEEFMLLGYGQRIKNTDVRSLSRIRACAVEALIGAIRIDRGLGVAELFISQFLIPRMLKIKDADVRDPKSLLIMTLQERTRQQPVYRVLQKIGSENVSTISVGVYAGNRPIGQASGPSRQVAEQRAARNALREHFNINLPIWEDLIE